MLGDGEEIALVDTREEGVYAQGHLLLAASLPLSRLELEAAWRLPRRDVRLVLVDADPGRQARAGAVLSAAGYTGLHVLDGFPDACGSAGLGIFGGKFVPSKAFGEVVEAQRHTPRISAAQLRDLQLRHVPLLLVDSRTPEEFTQFSLPGALSCPGAELVLRVPDAVPEGGIALVNCAGRTRSIIGTQSLVNAGIGCPVYAIENGTMGWRLDGHALAHGHAERLAVPRAAAVEPARRAALGLLKRSGGRLIGWAELQKMLGDAQRTTYFYDVRLREEAQQETVAGARNAPGGELVQSTDVFAPVRHARIVLADTQLVQAPMTAHWLRQMGWHADVLDPDTVPAEARGRPASAPWLRRPDATDALDVGQLRQRLAEASVAVVDCGNSIAYRHGHVPGAWFAGRGSLPESLAHLRESGLPLVFVSDDGALAQFAAADAAAAGFTALHLAGGQQAWVAAGGALESGWTRPLGAPDDIWYSPYEVEPGQREQAMREYIAWETGLLERIGREPGLYFQVL